MSPILKKYITIATLFLCVCTLWNCGNHSTESSSAASATAEGNTANVSLHLQYSIPPLLDSLVLDCYGTDTLHYVHSADNPNFSLELFPSDSWNFKAKIYANGALMQMGELETSLTAGTTVSLAIQMHPVVGFVFVEIPLGLKNDAGITGGSMKLKSSTDQYEFPMEMTVDGAIFKSDMLKLGCEYELEILLLNQEGMAIYSVTDKFTLTEDSPVPELTLNSLRSQVALAIKAAEERRIEITIPLKAGYRKPRVDDLLITEFYTSAAKTDTTQYEFIEIYNGSTDTLILDDCAIGATSNSAIRYLPLTTSEIAPRQVLVLGDATKDITPPLHINTESWNDITNSRGSIVLKCDGESLDSLYYAPDTDSLHAQVVPSANSKNGISTQLNIEQWKSRRDSTAWSLGKPTPGELN
ncbi:lamin tail domain-containing protein [Fibrobacter sp. UWH4]|uniref:lamin tail domain-containing protein n=1 Tax=Fibrobacter sp. UWH4 TaxID=1896210 RepID=UPI00091AF597|nr:lamin tail domain-containing protein [Fibrobacter sp. UWH4]SHL78063.1 Lamin Tail Domain [Fibrobacter sp. UWH4]